MKFSLLIIIISLFYIKTQAQSSVYHPFPVTTAVWRSLHTSSMGTNDPYYRQMQGDTIIGAYTYKRIYDVFGSSLYYIGAIRQDIPGKKVYWMNSAGGETLWFDFNMNVGDTVMFNPSMYDTLYVASIDSVQVGADYHKAFRIASVNSMTNPADIIEGVGYTSDFFWNYEYTFENNWSLLCFSENNVFQYPMVTGGPWPYQCFMTVGIGELVNDAITLTVMPNPAVDIVTISVGCQETYSIEVKNSLGEAVFSKANMRRSESMIDLTGYSAGIYFIRLSDLKGNAVTKKIVKQ